MRPRSSTRRWQRVARTAATIIAVAAALVAVPAIGPTSRSPISPAPANAQSVDRFLELYEELKNPANGYFSPQGVPYHSVETLMVEAPDHGHETTSEAFSFWLWLEAHYGQVTGDWQPFNDAWATTEQYIIPSTQDQPTNSFYNPASPATYAPELDLPSQYPSPLSSGVPVGQDPLAAELRQTYGTADIYGMHWLLDVDNVYGYGRCGDGTTQPNYINTYQRGPQESVWETVPHPSCETFTHGGPNGYLPLFIQDANYARQWRYTNAPDADARAVQAAYWAHTWASEQGQAGAVSSTVADASRMGDYLRYAMFDKYFKRVGNCVGETACPGGTGRTSAHYLMSWYYGWGGATDSSAGWAWRIGSSPSHFGYQNPMAAWALSEVSVLQPDSPTADADWTASLDRQLEFYQWLQSAEGAIAGGATNSWAGRYAQPPANTPTFYGMFYDVMPVYHDPPSNQWFGFQAWSMQRVAEYLYVTGDARAQALLDDWVDWAMSETTVNADGTYQIPSTLAWSGAPDTWNPANPGSNAGLHVDVVDHTDDVGTTAAYARTLMYYAAASDDTAAQDLAADLLDGMWAHRDDIGVSVPEVRRDYNRFDDDVYIPPGFNGTMPNGDAIQSGASFLDIRSFYEDDPDWPAVQSYLDGGAAPTFRYHRFWAQADVAMAMSDYARLFEDDTPPTTTTTSSTSSTSTSSSSTTSTTSTSSTTTTTTPGGACAVNYDVVGQWPNGFQSQVVVTNNAASAVDGWEVVWSFANGQEITQIWGGIREQVGARVSVRNETWNATIPGNGGSVTFGFLGSWSTANSPPNAITLNGTACTVT